MNMALHLLKGKSAEELARRYLERQGLQWKESNYRGGHGEIDLIMLDGQTLVFVEVRYRKSAAYGSAIETVNREKQIKLIAAASRYLQRTHRDMPCRFDVIGISGGQQDRVEWITNAFQAN